MISIRMKSLMIFSLSFFSCYAGDNSTIVLSKNFRAFIYSVSNLGSKLLEQVPSELTLNLKLAEMQKLYGENIEAAREEGKSEFMPENIFKACQVLGSCIQKSSLPVKVAFGVGIVLIPISLGYSGYHVCRAIKNRITRRNQKND